MNRHTPLILLLIITFGLLFHPYLPLPFKACLYAASLTIKSVIIFVLPFIIFSLLFKTVMELANRATVIISLIIFCLIASNYLATFLSHYVGEAIYHLQLNIITPPTLGEGLMPAWHLTLPKLIDNNIAMLLGLVFGLIGGKLQSKSMLKLSEQLNQITQFLLKYIIYLVPFFVVGFVMKLQQDGVMQMIIQDYLQIFGIIIITQIVYIVAYYFMINRFNLKVTYLSLKHILPAAIAGFTTMSSAAALPLTMNAVSKHAINKDIARSTVSVTTNIHLIGDCIGIPIFAYALMKSFGVPAPSLLAYSLFAMYFVIAKFSVAAVPGGGIIVMLPILEKHLGFSPDMLSLMLALYILMDPIVTAINILGNGAFAKGIDQLITRGLKRAPLQDYQPTL